MKKLLIASFMLLCAVSFTSAATESPDYFEGKWSVLIMGTPQGDATIPMRFETVDGVTTGYFIGDPSGTESTMQSVSISEEGVLNAAFNITGYDVTISMAKVEEDKANGMLMGMFQLEGTRVKE